MQLYKDEAPPENRKIKGRFHSATTDSITLRLKYGQTRTLEKPAVRKVLHPPPVRETPCQDSPPKRSGPAAALRLRPLRVGLGLGFFASAPARAWFSASRRLSTSRRAAGLMV